MQKLVFSVWKPVGWTPLRAVGEFKKNNHLYSEETISYAGRLDPMAEGVLLLLVGEENKKRKEYEDLKKEYKAEIVFGLTTDTFDSLGIITATGLKNPVRDKIDAYLKNFIGKQQQLYPPYSSRSINGKPLFWWARRDRLAEIEIPKREIEIYSLKLLSEKKVKIGVLVEKILLAIREVEGDFRQKEIIKCWEDLKKENNGKSVWVIKLQVSCSSGTYIRRIASDLGEKLGTGAFALSIKRTQVGKYKK